MIVGSLPPTSNKTKWPGAYIVRDNDTGEAIDISDADEIVVAIRDPKSLTPLLTATLTGGTISHSETGMFIWAFTSAQMRTLAPKTYDVGAVLTKDDEPVQLIIGTLPVLDGVIS